jgi:hypothetical protein
VKCLLDSSRQGRARMLRPRIFELQADAEEEGARCRGVLSDFEIGDWRSRLHDFKPKGTCYNIRRNQWPSNPVSLATSHRQSRTVASNLHSLRAEARPCGAKLTVGGIAG